MRRFVAAVVTLALMVCGGALLNTGVLNRAEARVGDGKIRVISTIFAPYDFARELVGESADVRMLLPPGSESHMYDPTPQDIIGIQNCDIFIYVGGESDKWVGKILEAIDTSGIIMIPLMECVSSASGEAGIANDGVHLHEEPGEHAAESHEHQEPHMGESSESLRYDEHVWTSPKNAKLIVERLRDALCEADGINSDSYIENAAMYIEKLVELDAEFEAVVNESERRTIVFGDRFPFWHLADAYGLECYAAFPGCSAESEPSAATVAFLIDKVKAENIPAVFHIELSNEKTADTICDSTGAKKLLMHSCHNISKDDFESGAGYIGLMRRNLEYLREALTL